MNEAERYDALLVEYKNVRDMVGVANQFLMTETLGFGQLSGLLERMQEKARFFESVPADTEPDLEVLKLRDTPVQDSKMFWWYMADGHKTGIIAGSYEIHYWYQNVNGPFGLEYTMSPQLHEGKPLVTVVLNRGSRNSAIFDGVILEWSDHPASYTILRTPHTSTYGFSKS